MGFGKWLGHEGSDLVNPVLESSFMVVLGRSGDLCDGAWLAELVSGGLLRGAAVVPVLFLSICCLGDISSDSSTILSTMMFYLTLSKTWARTPDTELG